MTISDKIALFSACATAIGVLVTGFFSFLLWRATIKSAAATVESARATESSARATEAATQLAKELEHQRKMAALATKNQLRIDILKQADSVLNFLVAHKGEKASVEWFRSNPRESVVPSYQIAEYFDSNEREIINKAWNSYDQYIKEFWTAPDQMIGIFNNSKKESEKDIALDEVMKNFLQILNDLK